MGKQSSTVHVALSHVLSEELQGLVSPVVTVRDNVLMGPSSTDPKRHQILRTRYWKDSAYTNFVPEIGTQGPLCLYLPPTASGLLTLCQICSIALPQEREIRVVSLGARPRGRSRGIDPHPPIVRQVDALLRRARPVRWSSIEVALAATLWKLWCRRSPTAFSRFGAAGSRLHPLISDLFRFHAGFFPRLSGNRLLLARYDELLLQHLSQEWSTPLQVYVKAVKADSKLDNWFFHTGDLYLEARLSAWFHHTQGRVIERRPEHPPRYSALRQWSFRWPAGGEAILEALPSLDVAPPVEIGGALAYDPDHPWVCRVDAAGRHVRALARFKATVAGAH